MAVMVRMRVDVERDRAVGGAPDGDVRQAGIVERLVQVHGGVAFRVPDERLVHDLDVARASAAEVDGQGQVGIHMRGQLGEQRAHVEHLAVERIVQRGPIHLGARRAGVDGIQDGRLVRRRERLAGGEQLRVGDKGRVDALDGGRHLLEQLFDRVGTHGDERVARVRNERVASIRRQRGCVRTRRTFVGDRRLYLRYIRIA